MNEVDERAYDVVLFGATGFTGGLTAEYLARGAPRELRWAIAGRSHAKLAQVKERLLAIDAHCASVGLVEAQLDDAASLQRMAAQTRVLLSTVGPFVDYGEPVVRACIAEGTDYVDSTGELAFLELLWARHDGPARERGVRLVPSCGFDAIPADLGALFSVRQLPPGQPIELAGYMRAQAQFSGGTERSALKTWIPRERLAVEAPRPRPGRRVQLTEAPRGYSKRVAAWTGPLETVDGPIVLRSAAALEDYGPDFRYSHNVAHASIFHMLAADILFGLVRYLMRFASWRAFFLKSVKASGTGPSVEQRARSWFKLRFIARAGDVELHTEDAGGDPGYTETSKMLAHAAMCLALERAQLPVAAGVLTPAQAMGDRLLARLQGAGLQFRVLTQR